MNEGYQIRNGSILALKRWSGPMFQCIGVEFMNKRNAG